MLRFCGLVGGTAASLASPPIGDPAELPTPPSMCSDPSKLSVGEPESISKSVLTSNTVATSSCRGSATAAAVIAGAPSVTGSLLVEAAKLTSNTVAAAVIAGALFVTGSLLVEAAKVTEPPLGLGGVGVYVADRSEGGVLGVMSSTVGVGAVAGVGVGAVGELLREGSPFPNTVLSTTRYILAICY